ncbi:Vps54-like protein-domain-containing protein, partial [Lactarius sanguifluus]
IEFLKVFSSQTCRVVLGDALCCISRTHLSLTSQSLSVAITLIPHVRETFRQHLSQGQAVTLVEFDKLKCDYQEHQNVVHSKLIASMGGHFSEHIKRFNGIRWDVPLANPCTIEYMELLMKETTTLHKALSRYLAGATTTTSSHSMMVTRAFAAINHRLSEEYAKSGGGPGERVARSLSNLLSLPLYLRTPQLSSTLKTASALTALFEILITDKHVSTMPLTTLTWPCY